MIELNTIYNESCLSTLERMPNESIDCVITSPPYWQLRDYGYDGQWGWEPTFQEYLKNLWSMMDEIYRVLKSTGTVWINLGDTYNTKSGSFGSDKWYDPKNPKASTSTKSQNINKGIKNKCLLLLPHRFAIGCIDRGWIIRNDIIWAKRNAMPESVTDRFCKKHEYFFFMVKSPKYFFDLDGIRDKLLNPVFIRNKANEIYGRGSGSKQFSEGFRIWGNEEKGKNPGSVSDFWDINTKPNKDEHYASYNDDLIKKPVISGCPEFGIIYDPFMGTGSTAKVAIRTNRYYIGSEMSKIYFDDCEKNLNKIKCQTKLF